MSTEPGAPTVSVIVPTRDRPALLSRTLRSVLNQRGVELEVIVVDDGSASELESVLACRDSRVSVIRHAIPRGVSAARNTGIEAARGEWLAWVDDDDLWAPDKLRTQLQALHAADGARWSSTGTVLINQDGRLVGAQMPGFTGDIARKALACNVIAGGGSTVIASRDLVQEVGGFDEALSCNADWEMWIRLALSSPIVMVKRPLVAFRIHIGSMSASVWACDQEHELICDRYADLRRELGVSLDAASWEEWVAFRLSRVGQRLAPARIWLRWGFRTRSIRSVVRALLVVTAPHYAELSDFLRGSRLPAGWREEVTLWLHPLTSGA